MILVIRPDFFRDPPNLPHPFTLICLASTVGLDKFNQEPNRRIKNWNQKNQIEKISSYFSETKFT